ncbi:hypothetical protein [Rhodococcus marinonascens]|uniref:hypothetical protein n=1 Tax=Rhodococcus marinonascens TaxID=38311 RepID=UPI0011147EBF|nr:hypothetical protein [Rhodococcus marinonascens]
MDLFDLLSDRVGADLAQLCARVGHLVGDVGEDSGDRDLGGHRLEQGLFAGVGARATERHHPRCPVFGRPGDVGVDVGVHLLGVPVGVRGQDRVLSGGGVGGGGHPVPGEGVGATARQHTACCCP